MRRRRLGRILVATVLIACLVAALVMPVVAAARAGGGHVGSPGRSSGGSSRSGGSSSRSGGIPIPIGGMGGGGGGGGGGIGTVIVIILVIGVVIYLNSRNKSGGSPTEGGSDIVGSVMDTLSTGAAVPAQVSFDSLKAADPDFSEQAFYGRVNEMFMEVQKAWQGKNMEPARRFLADEQFQVLQNGVQDYVRNGQVNKLDSLHIDRIAPISVQSEGGYDYVRVLITATVIDYTIDERTGEIVNPSVLGDGKTPKTFDEYWTLVRKQGAVTKADATIRKCPNCGAPVTDGNYVKCAYCGTQMNDPALDWVLMRIEQV